LNEKRYVKQIKSFDINKGKVEKKLANQQSRDFCPRLEISKKKSIL
jgi:hypothetical protein